MKPQTVRHRHTNITNDILLGALAGAAAIWATDKLDQAMYDLESPETRRRTIAARPGGLDPAHVIANRAAAAAGVRLDPAQPNMAGVGVHYGLGAIMGAMYGAMRRRIPLMNLGGGVGYGLLMFALQDEGLNTALGTGGRPSSYPWQDHARGFVAHGFFGFAVDTVLQVFRRR